MTTKLANDQVDSVYKVANILDFGAVGDGVTDNKTAIQAAIDTGRKVVIPVGDFLIESGLTDFTTMEGTNRFDSKIVIGAGFVGTVALAVNNFYTTFSDFQLLRWVSQPPMLTVANRTPACTRRRAASMLCPKPSVP